ncbi:MULTISPECIES: PBECR3 domain-containing polyvalent protein [Streptococcus]|uniref:Phage-Barnase-EndoU-ColicinE5/D-RelE like nuclease 3 domain-containing protein n=1 Tax=Streptococcus pseudopneumoniae TaxID=257758 RepID=A0A0U0CS89_9STRE|nr:MULTISPECIES: hypothetical protein [Streptococcus]AEL10358.1 hypothetical protein SPPN_04600 [Streptococcus pseudopneumoniae IS7493]EID25369.1 hypothetical protein HMPREF1046_0827 [Streptococcus pseudopneumoniae ATCC BAA-960 = CCUG 49455]EID70867.1 hypothetical protein HMPREF1112_0753 [Streptococcus pseudopneumoniae SK674]ETD95732.1 hypothetical protein U752_00865 [Streptococcus pseudopneumoniae 1321]ETD99730.1 hypothetical protein U753_08445 [Streptococcus pseudopneumoniae 5247]
MKKIGQITDEVKEIFDIVLEASDIKVNKDGLRSHMIKGHHNDVIHHIEDLELILRNPDFVGINPREKDASFEYVKRFDNNVLVAIKLRLSYIKVVISFMFRPCIVYKITSYKVVLSLVD